MRRVLVIGSPGAGKSAFSLELATLTGLPLTHLDAEYWQPGWVRPSGGGWHMRIRQLVAPDAWILDGNYTSTLRPRAERADTVVVLDYPRMLCLYRAVRRALLNRRPERLNLGQKPLDRQFLSFIWNFPVVGRRQEAELQTLPHLNVVRLCSDAQARAWLHLVRLELVRLEAVRLSDAARATPDTAGTSR
ncbi:DNA topology modulation protein FlaR [Deinococcus altitudinis]|uniref:DNA topology modulation protein FlaR n=1 Tax=Deinococcus altitudinis TaxID=468914 RepID=UPI0038929B2F